MSQKTTKRKYSSRFLNHYYNRLMLINTAIVCLVTVIYGIIASGTAFTYERVSQLKSYDYVLNQLHIHYSTKQDNFSNVMLTLYDDPERFRALSQMLELPDSDLSALGAFNKQTITKLLLSLCNKDADIHSVYIYKTNTQTLYAYTPTSNILEELGTNSSLYQELSQKEYPRTVYGARMLPQDDAAQGVFIYGIGGNLSSERYSVLRKPGSIMIAYNTNGLQHILQNKDLPFGGQFLIITDTGEIIYDSIRENLQKKDKTLYTAYKDLYSGETVISVNGTSHYISTIRDDKRGFLTAYLVPKDLVDAGSRKFVLLIAAGSLIFFGISVFIYILSSRFSTKRLTLLETAMTQIGLNNLSYRIPLNRVHDEFTAISTRFNEMCDELEENINTAYIYHLKQKSAELHALQASINPHFLYNTLEAIRGRLVQDGNVDAAEMIVILSRLYRNQIKGKTFVSIRDEISQCTMYLELFNLRHNNSLTFLFRIPNDLMKYAIPKNTLQPILENYLVHGMREENNLVEISALRTDDEIRITVTDNGRGMIPKTLKRVQRSLSEKDSTSQSGIGLSNVNERLKIAFGDTYGIEVALRENQPGTIVTLRIRALTVAELEMRHQRDDSSSEIPAGALNLEKEKSTMEDHDVPFTDRG